MDAKTTLGTARRRAHLERSATTLLVGFAIVMSFVCGSIIVSGWFAGVIEDGAERVFWAGALLAGLAFVALRLGGVPRWPRRWAGDPTGDRHDPGRSGAVRGCARIVHRRSRGRLLRLMSSPLRN